MAEIYRWVDAEGRVQFGERPAANAELLDIRPQVIERDEQVLQREKNIQKIIDVRAQEREVETARSVARRKQAKAQCDGMRRHLAKFEGRRFWYEEGADGKKVEVHPSRIKARKHELETLLQERC
ncbi:DUF4124 domain-containing protein [Pseudomonas profundi]|uniref:DUF4124 domain-containing protein n=1 Tax=Pseudomonas profundi TaxID=1981513 RepID=UPI003AB940A7